VLSPSTDERSRAWVEIDLEALRGNARRVLAACGPGVALIPMVKADAYGTGATRIVEALASGLAAEELWGVGVATVAEGRSLRGDGWGGRILVFSPVTDEAYRAAAESGLTLCLSSVRGIERWSRESARLGRQLPFHLEVDTGMGRAGLPWKGAAEWAGAVAAAAVGLRWEGVYTHFHSADEPDLGATDEQWSRFGQALELLPSGIREGLVVHVGNSAAAIRRRGYGCELVRPGIFLYGGAAGSDVRPQPVVSVRSRLGLVREVEPGTTVGYGATYAAGGPERWGTASIGYGDGLPRCLGSAGGGALVRGRRVPVIGRISMDATVLDLTGVPEAEEGDVATFVGGAGPDAITLEEVAKRCGTISYEILTGLSARLPRVYLGGESALDPEGAAPSRSRPELHQS
jgi:alanine racemase